MTKCFKLLLAMMAPILLSGCLLSPGKFTSEMEIDRDGSFTFRYDGEVYLLGFQNLFKAGAKAEEQDFKGECFEDDLVTERKCTAEEFEEQLAEKKQENERMLDVFGGLMGGIDPSSPDAIEEFSARLEKQKGWKSVTHKGDGIFEISYEMAGTLNRNFSFPELEKVQGITPFVVAIVRKDGSVRIDTPGFAADQGGSSLGMLGALGAMEGPGGADSLPPIPKPDGQFRITTNAEILTNNTEDGPLVEGRNLRVLSWTINQRSKSPPEALIKLD